MSALEALLLLLGAAVIGAAVGWSLVDKPSPAPGWYDVQTAGNR